MEIRVIREIRVLLNIEILVFFGWISMRGLVWVQLSIKQRVIYIYRTAIIENLLNPDGQDAEGVAAQ